jgi:hypothetical protein
MSADTYLAQILAKYSPRSLAGHAAPLSELGGLLHTWANGCYIAIVKSGSLAKGTAISLASDVDFLVSLTSDCNENTGGLKSIYDSLYGTLNGRYTTVRKQNVSVRLTLNGLQIDVTPARRHSGNTNYHWIYLSKSGSRQQTNVQKHNVDISTSGRTNEIRILKIWRELNRLEFPSIYLEYLLVKTVLSGSRGTVAENALTAFKELARENANPLFARVVDPANSSNILSDLLTDAEKNAIISRARIAASQQYWSKIVW